ncbi:sugar ABC transporter ATP-binding protein [Geminicoccus flavidas]|uniref:sugar ABC transporter ATP-binding protein n=1 Tax=Geminicoccus flavidas TaxID=2506407 RepID=UPI001359C6DE
MRIQTPSTDHSTSPPALAMHGLIKDFGGVRALDGAEFEARPGEIHGLVGQNGAGKSTLIKVLAGIYRPDEGRIAIDGQPVSDLTPHKVDRLGIQFIHQDRLLVPSFTVGEAVFLGRERTAAGLLARRRMEREARALIEEQFGVELPKGALISELTTAQQQLVQIVRALAQKPRILVFDEPTAALVKREVDRLFTNIERLRGQGITIVYISHYLQEIERLCDRVTVLRNGRHVGTVSPAATPAREIARMMVARDLGELFPKRQVAPGAPALAVRSLARRPHLQEVSFTLRRGEILGVTGLLGSGVKELVRLLFGLDRPDAGQIEISGQVSALGSPAAAVARGMALVPEDRRGQGVALDASVRDNTTLASLRRFVRGGLVRRSDEDQETRRLIEELRIRTPGPDTAVRDLSGGNQQKVVIAKWLARRSEVYLLDEPTVGVDIAAKVEIYRLVGELVERGAAVLLVSSDLDELAGIADRILVLYRGRIVRELAAKDASSDALLAWSTGAMEAA